MDLSKLTAEGLRALAAQVAVELENRRESLMHKSYENLRKLECDPDYTYLIDAVSSAASKGWVIDVI